MSSSECLKKLSAKRKLFNDLKVQEIVRPLLQSRPALLVRCNDGLYYTIHQPESRPSDDTLAASLLGSAMAVSIGLSVAFCSLVVVDEKLAAEQRTQTGLFEEMRLGLTEPGLYIASRLAGDVSGQSWAVPYLPWHRRASIVNQEDFLGLQILRTWSRSRNTPKPMFRRVEATLRFRVVFVGLDRLFSNLMCAPAPLPFPSFAAGIGPWDKKTTHAWALKLQAVAPLALDIALSAVIRRWPQLDPSDLHTVLLNRLTEIDGELLRPLYSA